MNNILIKNGTVVDPNAFMKEEKKDIFIENGVVKWIDSNLSPIGCCDVIYADKMIICHGLIDMHVHLRDPGYEYKEDIVSGTKAAIAGGFTSVACMPNTSPVNDTTNITEYIKDKARKKGYCDVYPIGAITARSEGKALSPLMNMLRTGDLYSSGVVAFSDDGNPVEDYDLMREAMELAKNYGVPIISHCEVKSLSGKGVVNQGKMSKYLGLPGIPNEAEEKMLERDIYLAKKTGCHLHVAHVSTKESVDMIRRAKEDNVKITAEVTPHHIMLTDDFCKYEDTSFKMNPPLRTEEDRQALVTGLIDRTIDVIASDHAPHSVHDKSYSFQDAPFGCIGLETTLPIVIDVLHFGYGLSYSQIIEKMTLNPTNILKLPREGLHVGDLADLVIIDPFSINKVRSEKFYSKSKNCPFDHGWLRGWPDYVIHKGKLVYDGIKGGII